MANQTIAIRVICTDPPAPCSGYETVKFGMQDKDKQVLSGHERSPNELQYEVELTVKKQHDGVPNFGGRYAHGTRLDRFLYLTQIGQQGTEWNIIQRIKIPLKTITWTHVQTVLDDETRLLSVKIKGNRTGTVPLLGAGWIVQKRDICPGE